MPSTPISQMTIGQAIMGTVATSAATGLIGSMFAPDPPSAPTPGTLEPPEPEPTADKEALTLEAERRGARSTGSRKSTIFDDTDLLGA
jgi:hypothetical protein